MDQTLVINEHFLISCLFVCLFVCSFVRLFVCSFVRLFVCSFVRLFVCSFVCLLICFISLGQFTHEMCKKTTDRGTKPTESL